MVKEKTFPNNQRAVLIWQVRVEKRVTFFHCSYKSNLTSRVIYALKLFCRTLDGLMKFVEYMNRDIKPGSISGLTISLVMGSILTAIGVIGLVLTGPKIRS